MTTYAVFFTSRVFNIGWLEPLLPLATLATTSCILLIYGTNAFAFTSARFSFAAYTICIAFVILLVLFVESIFVFISRKDATGFHHLCLASVGSLLWKFSVISTISITS